jgi:hypothetical protein
MILLSMDCIGGLMAFFSLMSLIKLITGQSVESTLIV